MFAAGSALAAGMSAAVSPARAADRKAPAGAVWRDVPDDPTKVPGTPTADDGGYGSRSQFEAEARWRYPTATTISSWTMTPLDKSAGIVTPSGLHFERHHGGIPTIDPARHSLLVHGMAQRPRKFSMADIKRFPSVVAHPFHRMLRQRSHRVAKADAEDRSGHARAAEHLRMDRRAVLHDPREVGLQEGATWVLAEGADAAVMTRSIPLEKR